MKVPWAQKIPTTYYDVDECKIHRYEAGPTLLPNGAGIVFEDRGRMRAFPRVGAATVSSP